MLNIGIDLGQARDATALVVLDSYVADAAHEGGRTRKVRHHDIIHVSKLRIGLAYPVQVEQIVSIAESQADEERPTLWVDSTGVGRPVVDLLRAACPYNVRAVTITSGDSVGKSGSHLSVPKVELIGCLEVAMSTRRLHAPDDLALADEMKKELAAFSVELSAAGRPLYNASSGHDDLVLALALAIFGAEHRGVGSASAFIDMVNDGRTELAERRRDKGEL